MIKLTNVFLVLCLLVSFKPGCVYASVIFQDDFNNNSLSKWDYKSDDLTWGIENQMLKGSITAGNQSFIYAKYQNDSEDYVISFDSKNIHGIDQHIAFGINDERDTFYLADLRFLDEYWPQDGGSIRLWKYINGSYNPLEPEIPIIMAKETINAIKIEMNQGLITISVNGQVIKNFYDEDKLTTNGFAFRNYAGSYFAFPVTNYFDNLKIEMDAEVVIKPKTIIIPGLGASWNEKAMVFNQTVANTEWKMTPFVKNYDNLINAFILKGLELNEDFYVWNYDWRKPLAEIKSDLDNFVENNVNENEKVNFVGHSLGGLVARDWAQEHVGDERLGEVITLGSPHSGSVDAYRVWSGGPISETMDASGIALNVMVQLQKQNSENQVDTVRRYAPIVKDLIPTFDFVKKDNKIVPISQLFVKNNYLASINQSNNLNESLSTWAGIGNNTEEWVKVGKRNRFEELLGWWPEGKILGYEYGDGDQTVLKKSAVIGSSFEEQSGLHRDLPNLYGQKIMEKFGLDGNYNWEADNDLSKSWVFYIGSPANIKVECQGLVKAESDDFVVIKSEETEGCLLKVTGKENGKYHLAYGLTSDENSWGYKESETQPGKVDAFKISSNNKLEATDKIVSDNILGLLVKLKNKYPKYPVIDLAIKSAKKHNWEAVLTEMFVFRYTSSERNISNLVIDELRNAMSAERGNKILASWWYQRMLNDEKNINNLSPKVRIGDKQLKSYVLWTKLMSQMKSDYQLKNYGALEADGKIEFLLEKEIMSWN